LNACSNQTAINSAAASVQPTRRAFVSRAQRAAVARTRALRTPASSATVPRALTIRVLALK
jgi:hypothetical protein